MKKKQKINVITLGCSKNLVDSERLMRQLEAGGYELVHDSDDPVARIVVINTCGFIGDAKEESINTILSFAASKEQGDIDHLFVFGCLSERYRDELRSEIPEVDTFFGVTDLEGILKTLNVVERTELLGERYITTPKHYAYLKISEGCSWGCAYCAIPLIRGKYVSVPIEELEAETRYLAAKGVKELIIIAQDTTYYGLDLYGERKLAELIRRLSQIEGIEWIRLHYAYPNQLPQNLIDEIRDNSKVCKYLDIPLQHINTAVLNQMRRGITKEETYDLIKRLREAVPDVALRTTLMVGHPGEDEAAFEELKQLVKDVKFDRMGVFTYSEEEGTYGAKQYEDCISEEVKRQRADELMAIQQKVAKEMNSKRVGETLRVMVDRMESDYYIARTEYDSPEVDQEVLIKKATGDLEIGGFYMVTITHADDFDLYGEPQLPKRLK
ncbi:MAG: 30S ribosomal protein S12 methylthiotransferase RimO [Prevotellaceae bacterium]|nr:30S ribosomal protein S12 methylthiotransferase RimO [Prevotellaceae bacterium]